MTFPQRIFFLVLLILTTALFEPLEFVPIALLIAVTCGQRVGDLYAPSVSPACMLVLEDFIVGVLHSNLAYMSNNIPGSFRSRVITLQGF